MNKNFIYRPSALLLSFASNFTEVKDWLMENRFEYEIKNTFDPLTFEPLLIFTVKDDIAVTAFILRWGHLLL